MPPNQECSKTTEYGPAVTFEEFKAALGESAKKYTDEQIDHMRLDADRLANAVFDSWLLEQKLA